jgi:hypothetical protein
MAEAFSRPPPFSTSSYHIQLNGAVKAITAVVATRKVPEPLPRYSIQSGERFDSF